MAALVRRVILRPDLLAVGEAASAEEALIALEAGAVDVVVTDQRMPGRGGAELIRGVRNTLPTCRC